MNDEKKIVEREAPEKLAERLKEKEEQRGKLVKEFYQVSIERAYMVKREQELLEKMDNNTQATRDAILDAERKMGLIKEVGYNWKYVGNGKFIGVAVPLKPEEKK